MSRQLRKNGDATHRAEKRLVFLDRERTVSEWPPVVPHEGAIDERIAENLVWWKEEGRNEEDL